MIQIPKYWHASSVTLEEGYYEPIEWFVYGYSFESLAEAEAMSRRKAEARRVEKQAGGWDGYDYEDLPLREPIVGELERGEQTVALVTRNRYGAIVLNTAEVMFVDIDLNTVWMRGFWSNLRMIFSARARSEAASDAIRQAIEKVSTWSQEHPDRNVRVYRTLAGLRVMLTDRLYSPDSDATREVLQSLACDPLYIRLTQRQQCFRARLTPKPWRCGLVRPKITYPYLTPEHEERLRDWVQDYEQKSKPYGTCHLLLEDDPRDRTPEAEMVIQLHDRYALVDAETPLA